jgi:predicted RNA-binding Zn-ribbon protein involved in translation (DUF1610 family)
VCVGVDPVALVSGYICILTDDVLASIGIGIECANCTDASWFYRDEQPILNGDGVKFCSVECADEYDTRNERAERWLANDWCPDCGFDNHEHNVGCPKFPEGRLRPKKDASK